MRRGKTQQITRLNNCAKGKNSLIQIIGSLDVKEIKGYKNNETLTSQQEIGFIVTRGAQDSPK